MPFPWIGSLRSKRGGRAQGFSVICACNDQHKLERFLLPSLRRQGFPYDLNTVDTRHGGCVSAAATLNKAAEGAKRDYLMFVHQDVSLDSDTWLADVDADLARLGRFGAAGVAGGSSSGLFASVTHGDPPRRPVSAQVLEPVRVQTLDGCLMIVPRGVFELVGFDEMTCDGWHLYVANFCLDLDRLGYRVFVLPHPVYHESTGPADPGIYEGTRRRIMEKHRDRLTTIYTTVGMWKTEAPSAPP